MTCVGYLRVSTDNQDPDRQKEELSRAFTIDEWYADIGSGMSTTRSEFERLMSNLTEIDTVVVWESSRLTRDLGDFIEILESFEEHEVKLMTLDMLPDFDPESPMSRAMVQVVMSVQQMEREQIRERVQSGVDRAIKNGKHVGEVPTGFQVDQDGFLMKREPDFTKVTNFVREVNKGRPKSSTAEWFGFNSNSAQSILETTRKDYPYEERYIGDEQWREERTKVQNGEKQLLPLGDS